MRNLLVSALMLALVLLAPTVSFAHHGEEHEENPDIPCVPGYSITLTGANPLALTVGDTYVEPGATVSNSCDHATSEPATVSGTVDTATVGEYIITYTGHEQTATRTVIVSAVVVVKKPQTVIFTTGTGPRLAGGTESFTATSTSGLKPAFHVEEACSDENTHGHSKGTVNVKFNTAGTCTLKVHQHGNAEYEEAPEVVISFPIIGGNPNSTPTVGSGPVSSASSASVTEPTVAQIETPSGEVLGASTSVEPVAVVETTSPEVSAPEPEKTCEPLLTQHLKHGRENDMSEVSKLRSFLISFEGMTIAAEGVFDQELKDAVIKFQEKYMSDILAPWGITQGTGYVYIKTIAKINALHCAQ